jgi:hypothetical protein
VLIELSRHWSRWRQLPRAERRTLVAFALALPLIDIGIRAFGLKRTQNGLSWLARKTVLRPCSGDDLVNANRLAELANIAGTHGIYHISCLRQAVLVQHRLRRQGLPVKLRIGARKIIDSAVEAHAWVELEGVALGQRDLGYSAFPDMDQPSP